MKMNLKVAFFTALTSVAALTGCDDKTSVEWYMAHHDDMLVKYRECFFNQNFEPIDCQHARDALHREMNSQDVKDGYSAILKDFRKSRYQAPVADLN
jgi:hypothetical protein